MQVFFHKKIFVNQQTWKALKSFSDLSIVLALVNMNMSKESNQLKNIGWKSTRKCLLEKHFCHVFGVLLFTVEFSDCSHSAEAELSFSFSRYVVVNGTHGYMCRYESEYQSSLSRFSRCCTLELLLHMIKNIYALILWITAQHGESEKKKAHLINTLKIDSACNQKQGVHAQWLVK